MTRALGIGIGAESFASVLEGSGSSRRGQVVREPAVLHVAPGGQPVLGDRAAQRAKAAGGNVFRDFTNRVGDPVPVLTEHSGRTGAELVAMAVRCIMRDRLAGPAAAQPISTVLAYPSVWTGYPARALESELARETGAPTLVPEAEAAYVALTVDGHIRPQATVLLCDIGSAHTDLAVVSSSPEGRTRVERPTRSTDFSGTMVDSLLLDHVISQTVAAHPRFDPANRINWPGIRALRNQIRIAKERLSQDVSAVIGVSLPGIEDRQRLVRSELETLIADPVRRLAYRVAETAHSAQQRGPHIDAVVLIGGTSAIPALAEQLSTAVPLPVITSPEPGSVVVRGAALIAARTTRGPRRPSTRESSDEVPATRVLRPVQRVPGERRQIPRQRISEGGQPIPRNRPRFAAPEATEADAARSDSSEQRSERSAHRSGPGRQRAAARHAAEFAEPASPAAGKRSFAKVISGVAAAAVLLGGGIAAVELGHSSTPPAGRTASAPANSAHNLSSSSHGSR